MFAVVLIALSAATRGKASVITTGTILPPDIFTFVCPGAACPTMLTSLTTPWTNTTGDMSGTLKAAVFSDPGNPFGIGDLDFVYQVSNNGGSTDSIGRVTAINFTGWATDVGYASNGSALGNGFLNGTVAPELVDRASADVIGFNFASPILVEVRPGQTSTALVIETNAKAYVAGDVNIINGGVTTVSAFEPSTVTPVPEPGYLAIAGIAFLALTQVRRFRQPS